MKSCTNCIEFRPGHLGECTYNTCRNDRLKLFDSNDIAQFCKELYEKSGVFISESCLRKNIRLLKDHITTVM